MWHVRYERNYSFVIANEIECIIVDAERFLANGSKISFEKKNIIGEGDNFFL